MTSDPDVLAAARAELNRPEGDRSLYILGPLAEGDGGHNVGWDWHFVPGGWELTDTSMDLCDADPAIYRRCASGLDQEDRPLLPKGSAARRREIAPEQSDRSAAPAECRDPLNSPHSLSSPDS